MQITTLFWNTWLDNHINSVERSKRLCDYLEGLISQHQPHVLGLNEAMTYKGTPPKMLDVLKNLGYQVVHTTNSPLDDDWHIGSILATKIPTDEITIHKIGKDTPAERRGYPGHHVKQTFATIRPADGPAFTFGVVHLLALYPKSIPEHYRQQKPFAKIVNDPQLLQPVIIGGDFNETKYMPASFYSKIRRNYRRKTGNYIRPTWTPFGKIWSPIRVNYDHVYWSRHNPNIHMTSFEVITDHPSDHAPLITTFEITTAD